MKRIKKQKNRFFQNEKGAVIIEAAIALPVFMFMMFTIYSVIQMAYVQARMTIAVDAAAKELAEYAHVYYATGLNNSMTGSGGASSEMANEVSEFLMTVGNGLGSVNSELGQFVGEAGAAMSGDSLADLAKYGVGQALGEQMMKKNMVSGTGDNAEAFMKRNRIKNFNMNNSRFLEKESKDIFLTANYDIQVIRLLNIDFSFHLSSCAYAQAWGGE